MLLEEFQHFNPPISPFRVGRMHIDALDSERVQLFLSLHAKIWMVNEVARTRIDWLRAPPKVSRESAGLLVGLAATQTRGFEIRWDVAAPSAAPPRFLAQVMTAKKPIEAVMDAVCQSS